MTEKIHKKKKIAGIRLNPFLLLQKSVPGLKNLNAL